MSYNALIDIYCTSRYAQYGDVSPKIDVYAFGVVLYELISAKEAVVKTNRASAINESKGLVALVDTLTNFSFSLSKSLIALLMMILHFAV